jgi:hypothetical protein
MLYSPNSSQTRAPHILLGCTSPTHRLARGEGLLHNNLCTLMNTAPRLADWTYKVPGWVRTRAAYSGWGSM